MRTLDEAEVLAPEISFIGRLGSEDELLSPVMSGLGDLLPLAVPVDLSLRPYPLIDVAEVTEGSKATEDLIGSRLLVVSVDLVLRSYPWERLSCVRLDPDNLPVPGSDRSSLLNSLILGDGI